VAVGDLRPLPAGQPPARGRRAASLADRAFDAALAQLVVQFMADPAGGLPQMARVTCRGGLVAACVWDHAGGAGPLAAFWQAVHRFRRGGLPSWPGNIASPGVAACSRPLACPKVHLPDWPEVVTPACAAAFLRLPVTWAA
jgi:hypothetical protein